MKAILFESLGTSPAVRDDVPDPAPAAGEVLVRVRGSSANPVDNAIAAGMLEGMVEHEFPVTLGRDYAGVVEAVGDGVTRFAAGDEVFGFFKFADPTVHDGTWAERITVAEDGPIGRAPGGVDLVTAGAAPLAGITALTALDALELSDGDTLLLVGATGGVGSFAAQHAAKAGITVIAPALAEDEDWLRGLGVAEVVDRDGDVAAAVRERAPEGADGLLDLVSYSPGAFDGALKDGARVASPNSAAGEGPGRTNVMAVPSQDSLTRLAALLEDGTLTVPVQDTYGLDRAPEALQALGGTHTQGKIAIRIA
jgi:NADPH:quinone reductase